MRVLFQSILRGTLAVALLAFPLAAQEVSRAVRDMFNVGVRLFEAEQYRAAAESFQKAVDMAPNLFQARVYLATSYVQMFVPGDNSAANREIARQALDALANVLQKDPKNLPATDSMASIYLQMRDLPNATDWVHRVLMLNPGNKAALTTIGLISWLEFNDKDREARQTLDMKPGDPGPLPDDELRYELKAQYGDKLQEGLGSVQQVLADDATYSDAMAAMARLLRAKADLADTESEYQAIMAEADDWARKAGAAPTTKAGNK